MPGVWPEESRAKLRALRLAETAAKRADEAARQLKRDRSEAERRIRERCEQRPVVETDLPRIGDKIKRARATQMSTLELYDAVADTGLTEADILLVERGRGFMLDPARLAAIVVELELPILEVLQ